MEYFGSNRAVAVVVAVAVGVVVVVAVAVVVVLKLVGAVAPEWRSHMVAKKVVKKSSSSMLPFKVGDKILVRTVTMIQVGKVRTVTPDFIVLDEASWVADTGRFGEALASGTLGEVEKCPSWVLVCRGSIVDLFPWDHALPTATK